MSIINTCSLCHKKQEEINRLKDEITHLKGRLAYRERKEKEGFFGSSTPSSQQPVKASTQEKPTKPRGAKAGHKGFGRKALALADADHVERIEATTGELCPLCGHLLEAKGDDQRSVLDSHPVKAAKIIYHLERKRCCRCHKTFRAEAPGVLPKNLYGNQLMANAAVMHYLHGMPVGRVCEQLGIGDGALLNIFHRMAQLFAGVVPNLVLQYRQSLVKHADETSWRTNGKNGYAWLFATLQISIFLFKKTRSASVPREVFGQEQLPGVLVVDRYSGYNKMSCDIQYCYSHLLRHRQGRIQDIFTKNEKRLYHWAENRHVPPENNLAERDLRPTVIARKVSFGSQSDGGAYTRGVLMTVVHTLKKQGVDAAARLKYTLDQLAKDMKMNPYHLLFTHPP